MSTVLKSVPDSPDKLWGKLRRNDPEGEAYLAGRGLSRAAELGFVRFNCGEVRFAGQHKYRVVVPMYEPDSDTIHTMQARAINPDVPKDFRQRSMTGILYPNGAAMGKVKEARTAKRVYCGEGIADTLALLLAGVTAIGAPGTGSLKHLLKFLGRKIKGREVVLCVQNDEKGQSAKAFADLEKALRKAGATVLYLRTPQDVGKDPADWLKKIGEEAFAVAAESAVLVPETVASIEPEKETAANDDEGVTTTSPEARQDLADALDKIDEAKSEKGVVLYKQSYRIGRWVGGHEMVEEEASEAFRAAARAAGIADYKGHITRGIRDGKKNPRTGAIKTIAKQLAFVAKQNCYWNMTSGGPLFGAALETKHRQDMIAAGYEKAKLVHTISPFIAQADDLGWEPGRTPLKVGSSQDRIFEENGKRLFNMWRDPPAPPGKGKFANPKLWLAHVKYIIPKDEEREHFLDILAYNVQYLGGKVNQAIVLQGERGIGKDAMWKPLSAWFGTVDAWGEAGIDELESQFDYHFNGKKVLLIGEATAHGVRDARALYDKMKSRISATSGGKIRINMKNLHPIDVPNRLQLIYTTNYGTALWFDTAKDRAHFVIKSPLPIPGPEQAERYNRLHEFYGDVDGREGVYEKGKVDVIGWLAHRPLTGRKGRPDFDPKAPAPHTKARDEMYEATRSGNERVVGEAIDGAGVENEVVLSVRAIADLLRSEEHRRALEWLTTLNRQAVGKLFAERGYSTDRINVTVNGKETKHTIYYKGMSKEDATSRYRAKLRKAPGGG